MAWRFIERQAYILVLSQNHSKTCVFHACDLGVIPANLLNCSKHQLEVSRLSRKENTIIHNSGGRGGAFWTERRYDLLSDTCPSPVPLQKRGDINTPVHCPWHKWWCQPSPQRGAGAGPQGPTCRTCSPRPTSPPSKGWTDQERILSSCPHPTPPGLRDGETGM